MEAFKVTIIGAGNVGFHFAQAIHSTKHELHQVFSRNPKRFEDIYPDLTINVTSQIVRILPTADIYLLAVCDDVITEVAQELKAQLPSNALIAHTSGATSMLALEGFTNFGIFYPLQTFVRDEIMDYATIPFCIDGNLAKNKQKLVQLAASISPHIYQLSDEQRQILHVAAVFANNFVNHLCVMADHILTQNHMDFDILQPLIAKTFHKIKTQDLKKSQTGPAKRGDVQTIEKHIDLLAGKISAGESSTYQKIYKLLSRNILTTYKK